MVPRKKRSPRPGLRLVCGLACAWLLLACGRDGHASDPPAQAAAGTAAVPAWSLALAPVVEGLREPVYLDAPPGDPRLFLVERFGRILVLEGGRLLPTPFLDWSRRVETGFGEQGLLSVAFHPDYATSGRFFIYFTERGSGDVVISELRTSADRNRADPESAKELLRQPQFARNHNGGQLRIGPDGKLYAGLGDGGAAGDPREAGQDLGTWLGAVLRLEVEGSSRVPADNPFVGRAGALPEIWAWGLRNPWRFSFDRDTGDLYIADVGQNRWEEVHFAAAGAQAGLNYGWNVVEGLECFRGSDCPRTDFVDPMVVYPHKGGHCSVTGGSVYRGSALPELRGWYLYGDFCSGMLRALKVQGGALVQDLEISELVGGRKQLTRLASFGEDAAGELYLVLLDGRVLKLVPGGGGR
jgi:glucose/arabinose dehydrogenase